MSDTLNPEGRQVSPTPEDTGAQPSNQSGCDAFRDESESEYAADPADVEYSAIESEYSCESTPEHAKMYEQVPHPDTEGGLVSLEGDTTPTPSSAPTVGQHVARGMRGVLETILPAIVIALFINLFLAQATRVYGQSMEPSLHSNQRLVVEKLSYSPLLNVRSPQRGDVVVIRVPGDSELLIKRVIGLPGDHIEVHDNQVFINAEPLNEAYVAQPTQGSYGPMDVPPLHLFVMGDNRNFSNDSRVFGPIPIKDVVGRAWLSYWPPDQWGPVR